MDNTKVIKRTKCEIFSRAMGFYRPISYFNIGKRAEFEERKTFTEENALNTLKKNKKTDII